MVSGKVPDDPLIRADHQGGMCCAMLGKVPDDYWVPDGFLVLDDPLIHANHQGETCCAVSGRVPDDCWVPDDPL